MWTPIAHALEVRVQGRSVPTAFWQPHNQPAPLVLLGHGGGTHKAGTKQLELARALTERGISALAIDGPAHGERASRPDVAPGEYQAELVTRGVAQVVQDMVDDWTAALVSARSAANVTRVGYLGFSMGTRFGLPLSAALGDELDCAVLGKFGLEQAPTLNPALHLTDEIRHNARNIRAPTLWHMQWDDEIFPRAGSLELFDDVGAPDKQLIALPGGHGDSSDFARRCWLDFLSIHLRPEEGH